MVIIEDMIPAAIISTHSIFALDFWLFLVVLLAKSEKKAKFNIIIYNRIHVNFVCNKWNIYVK